MFNLAASGIKNSTFRSFLGLFYFKIPSVVLFPRLSRGSHVAESDWGEAGADDLCWVEALPPCESFIPYSKCFFRVVCLPPACDGWGTDLMRSCFPTSSI